jgi:uncharacterized Zn finger protein
MLPGISGSCVACGSEDVRVLSTSPATAEVLVSCAECGEQVWEDDMSHPRNCATQDDVKAAA